MILFKIIKTPYVETWATFQLTSTFRNGARWNSPGQPAMYLASNVQNAMLEIANYSISPKMANKLYRLAVFEFPTSALHRVEPSELPVGWNEGRHTSAVQKFGDDLLRSSEHDGFIVPTVAVHDAIAISASDDVRETAYHNVILNLPKFDLSKVHLIDQLTPIFSKRMFIHGGDDRFADRISQAK